MTGMNEVVGRVRRYRQVGRFALLLLVGLTMSEAQAVQAKPLGSPASPVDARADIKIHPGDTVSITVYDTPELTGSHRVSEDGTVYMPLIGGLRVGGLSEASAARLVDFTYMHQGYTLHPGASVLIHDFASQGVSILGEVERPGIYPLSGPRSLVDVIALAGGLTIAADTRLILRRAGNGEAIDVSLPRDDGKGVLENDIAVAPGDRIVVQRAGMVYVLGEVGRPGSYVMQHNGAMTVLQAIAQASGTTRVSGEKNVFLLHPSAGTYTMEHLPLRDMYKGRHADVSLTAGDVIYVPGSTVRNFTANAPQLVGQIAGAAVYAVNR